MDTTFKKWATVQIRSFLFSGHDSTASAIEYCYHYSQRTQMPWHASELSTTRCLEKICQQIGTQLLDQPHKINMLPYTTAVLKESMRLFLPLGCPKGPPRRKFFRTLTGIDFHRWNNNLDHAQRPAYKSRLLEGSQLFLPERWLVGPEHPLYPVKGAWRPFEFGSRNCIGQTLVMQNVKTVLAMTLREFDVCGAFNEEWDKLHPRKGLKTAYGERAYHVFRAAAHPADGFPCKIARRKGLS